MGYPFRQKLLLCDRNSIICTMDLGWSAGGQRYIESHPEVVARRAKEACIGCATLARERWFEKRLSDRRGLGEQLHSRSEAVCLRSQIDLQNDKDMLVLHGTLQSNSCRMPMLKRRQVVCLVSEAEVDHSFCYV
jgi:hypothetical protein